MQWLQVIQIITTTLSFRNNVVYFPTIFTIPITISFKYNPSTTLIFTHLIRVLVNYGNCLFPDFLNYFI